MRWLWLVVAVSVASAENFCISFEHEVESILQIMANVLREFDGSQFAVTADVVLGLKIATVVFETIPKNQEWGFAVDDIRQACERIIVDYLEGKLGDHETSQNLIPYMVNSALWRKIIKPGKQLESSGNSLSFKNYQISLNHTLSDRCFQNLFEGNCATSSDCFAAYDEADKHSFEKTHFLLYLQISGALGCGSENWMNFWKLNICREMYANLVSSIENSNFLPEVDILLEEIVLCGIEGYDMFLSRKIQNFVKRFVKESCFDLTPNYNLRMKKTDSLSTHNCHSHTNAVGFAAQALFLKSFIKKCYY